MHHPIQMKPADSENRNGECHALHAIYYRKLFSVAIGGRGKKNCFDENCRLWRLIMHHHCYRREMDA